MHICRTRKRVFVNFQTQVEISRAFYLFFIILFSLGIQYPLCSVIRRSQSGVQKIELTWTSINSARMH